jgi:hypothetical protein
MRRLKMLLMSAVVTVAMLVALAGPAMADDFCCDSFGSPLFLGGDRFIDGRDVIFLDEDCDVEDVDEFGNIIFVVVDCD